VAENARRAAANETAETAERMNGGGDMDDNRLARQAGRAHQRSRLPSWRRGPRSKALRPLRA